MIKQVSLAHGWYYYYRINTMRLDYLSENFSDLKSYMMEMLTDCPDEHFTNGGPRSSKLRMDLGIDTIEVDNHPVSKFAEEGLRSDRFKTKHSKVQVHMLENDPQTIAVEVPIWLHDKELTNYETIFEDVKPLSGHIDLVRWEGNKLWIWDYKPNAHREKYATTQTFFYALMLSRRTGVPIDDMMCGYFDKDKAYVFKPEEKCLENNEILV